MAGSLARRIGMVSAACVLAIVGAFALYAWVTLHFEYSNGERAGVLQKFSKRGWVCKTYEGELALYVVAGVQPEIWTFTVREAAVARQLTAAVGQRVQLHYIEHRGVPSSCFGDTRYFVDRINAISGAPLAIGPEAR